MTITTSKTAAEGIIDRTQAVKVEPLDVPAIQEDYISAKKGDSMPNNYGWLLDYGEDQHSKRWTCADKERILEHSESGKYWCRKVQP